MPNPFPRDAGSAAVAQLEPACEECGYLLRGLPAPGREPVCPECGTRFDPANPWVPKAWPPAWRIAVACCAPAFILLSAFLLLSAFRSTRNPLIWPLLAVWGVTALVFTGLVPRAAALSLAGACEPRIRRRAVARRVWIPACVASAIAVLGALVIFRALI